MARSPLSRNSRQVDRRIKTTHNDSNVVPLTLTIPYMEVTDRVVRYQDITHFTHRSCDINQDMLRERLPYIQKFSKKCHKHVENGKSARSIACYYGHFQTYITYCDANSVNPFSREGYLKYFGNDGELRHQIKQYNPTLRIWQRKDGEELGIKESSCTTLQASVEKALTWCGAFDKSWKNEHRHFKYRQDHHKPYSEPEEKMIVSRLSELFFGLALPLIAMKKESGLDAEEIPVTIDFDSHYQELIFSTSLNSSRAGENNFSCAFNVAMGAAYHLFCYFSSLNTSVVLEVCHPLTVNMDNRDKSLKTVQVTGFKGRSNKQVSAMLSNEVSDGISFDVEKKSGVTFIEVLSELSKLYGSDKELIYHLDKNGDILAKFSIAESNKFIVTKLNLVTSHRALNLPWFSELFYTFQKGKAIDIKAVFNKESRSVVVKNYKPLHKAREVLNILDVSYLILSCFTDEPLKGALLPLRYSDKDKDGNIQVSYLYDNGEQGSFNIPVTELSLVKDIEAWAKKRADKAPKNHTRYLFRYGNIKIHPKQWEGVNPISSNQVKRWSIEANDYFITLQASRFRQTTSIQEYEDGHLSHLKNLLQNTLATLERNYANGNPETNKKIIYQAIKVLERISSGISLEVAKVEVAKELGIKMLTHDEWLQKKTPTNPNGVMCNGKQVLKYGKSTQRATNKAIGRELPCSEFDICYKCNSARAVDEPNAIYKLISFIDVLKEALDRFPEAKYKVIEKIDAYEYTLEGATTEVYEEAMNRFNKYGRHPRVTSDHALLAIYR
ncbi:hypothetical protein ACSTK8_14995 [Vibrio parahaemolyticus]